jgi:hypothetical protein
MSAVSDLLAQAKLPELVVPVCIRGDLAAEHEQLDEQLTTLRRDLDADDLRVGDPRSAELTALAERIQHLEAEMKAATVPFRFRAQNRSKKAAVLLANPPREGDAQDKAFGANRDTYYAAMIRACLVDPEPASDEEFEQLLDVLSDGQFQELAAAAVNVSGGPVTAPFSRAASAIIHRSSEASAPPAS